MPQSFGLTVYRGDSQHWRFTLYADPAQAEPFDLVGATAKAEIRARAGGPVLTTLACQITQPNVVDVDLTAGQSGALAEPGVWDLQLSWADGTVRTVAAGRVTVIADVTESTRP